MKNKAPLSLMEQLCMLLVFALSAALCLQIYVFSAQLSRRSEARGQAVTQVQNAAESIKYCKGDAAQYPALLGGEGDEQRWIICYDESWEKTSPEQASYRIIVDAVDSGLDTLGQCEITALTKENDELFSIVVSWQEVAHE